jgi:hypothetical protein
MIIYFRKVPSGGSTVHIGIPYETIRMVEGLSETLTRVICMDGESHIVRGGCLEVCTHINQTLEPQQVVVSEQVGNISVTTAMREVGQRFQDEIKVINVRDLPEDKTE